MKINKVIFALMVLVFAVSNTGLPLFIHLCNSMQKVSLESCAMCEVQQPSGLVSIGRTGNCCENKSVGTPILEKYILSKDNKEIQNVIDTPIIVENITINNFSDLLKNTSIYDSSPPGTINNSHYLYNSVLLI